MTADDFNRTLAALRFELSRAPHDAFGPSKEIMLRDSIDGLIRDSEADRLKRERERLEGLHIAATTPMRAPRQPITPTRAKRYESPRRWSQAVRAFQGRTR